MSPEWDFLRDDERFQQLLEPARRKQEALTRS
jgi:hypothetical protein